MNDLLDKSKGTDIYDDKLNKIHGAFFGNIHPELLPYIGKNYEKTKILLVGESHYVDDSKEYSFEDWYTVPVEEKHPLSEYKKWFDTRQTIARFINGEYNGVEAGRGNRRMFENPLKVFHDYAKNSISDNGKEDFCYFAFMNFFQRPASKNGKSIKNTDNDNKIANEILTEVIKITKPETVIFLSKKAHKTYKKFYGTSLPCDVRVEAVAHPTCMWWNREEGKYGHKKFAAILEETLKEKNLG